MDSRPRLSCRNRTLPFLIAFLAILPAVLRAEYRPVDLTLIGMSYGAPMRPSGLANFVDDGFSVRGQLDIRPSRVFALCVGAERMRFYRPAQFHFLVGTVDFSAKLILPPLLGGVGYLQTGVGLNVLGDKAQTWGGKTCGRVILGKKIPVAPGFGFDLAVGYHMMGKPEAFKYVDVRAGMCIGIGRDKDPKEKKTVTPTATVSRGTPASSGTPTPVKGSPTPMRVPSATATPNVISLESDVPTFTPTVTSTSGPVTLTLADRTMKETYDAGYAAYRAGKYVTAIRLWKKALAIKDATQFWYYAEANAMIGAVYHYKVQPPNRVLAKRYYQAALKIDPKTATALKGMKRLKATAPPVKPKPKPKPADDLSDSALGIKPTAAPAK